jgi:A/G-specific adenine glycosylase
MRTFATLTVEQAAQYLWPPFSVDELSLSLFREHIHHFYQSHGRQFAWRQTRDPYQILLSEVMLQQTQTTRVEPKYELFVSLWPTLKDLAGASTLELLTHWKGLGYNRRALYLQRTAQMSEEWGWTLPNDEATLRALPGVGKATSAALLAFAFDQRSIYLETNVRRVILHCFFSDQEGVRDRQVEEVLARLIAEEEDPKSWYYGLLDYGVLLKTLVPNPNRRSAHYTRQSAFENSNRQIRGMLIHLLTESGRSSEERIIEMLCRFEADRITGCLAQLSEEGFVEERGGVYGIKES